MIQRIVYACLLSITVFTAVKAIPETVMHCTVHSKSKSAWWCYQIKNGNAVAVGKFQWPDAEGKLTFTTNLKQEGVFFLKQTSAHGGLHQCAVYLKPGDVKNIEIFSDGVGGDSSVIQDANIETKYLQEWVTLFNKTYKTAQVNSRKPHDASGYNQLETDAVAFKKSHLTKNIHFNKMLNDKINGDLLFFKGAAFFFFNERVLLSGYDTSASMATYYQTLQKESLCRTASFLGSEHGMASLKFIMSYRTFMKTKNKEALEQTGFYQNASLICNDTLKGLYVAEYMGGLKDYESVMNYVAPYQQYFYDSATRKAYELKKASFSPYAKGATAYNFALKDQHDKQVRLSDYKGKIVVMDMWAMWCAPCLQEKPIFKQLEASYKDNPNIVFLGLSVDGSVKKEAWKAFVTKKGWNDGTELLSEPNEDISKYYQIGTIPRFFIFDKEGKIVTVDAPRPSDPAFKQLIEQTLAASAK